MGLNYYFVKKKLKEVKKNFPDIDINKIQNELFPLNNKKKTKK